MHDGVAPYPGALDCLAQLRRAGQRVALLSNVPARVASVEKRLDALGIAADRYDLLRSSGEEVWEALAGDIYGHLGEHYFLLGPAHYDDIGPATRFVRTRDMARADFVLCTGLRARSVEVEDDFNLLEQAARAGLPLICANPDLTVMRGARNYVCAGALARAYEDELDGRVHWHGKPHPTAFAACLEGLGIADPGAVLMVGDTLHTDIAGGARAGMDTVLIGGGIHRTELGLETPGDPIDPDRLAALLADAEVAPDAVLATLSW